MGPCGELETHPEVDLPSPIGARTSTLRDSKKDKVDKEMNKSTTELVGSHLLLFLNQQL